MRGGAVAKPIALTQQSSSKEESVGSPYLVARREWDERYGGLIKRGQQWRGAAGLAFLRCLPVAIGLYGVTAHPSTFPLWVALSYPWIGTLSRADGTRHLLL